MVDLAFKYRHLSRTCVWNVRINALNKGKTALVAAKVRSVAKLRARARTLAQYSFIEPLAITRSEEALIKASKVTTKHHEVRTHSEAALKNEPRLAVP